MPIDKTYGKDNPALFIKGALTGDTGGDVSSKSGFRRTMTSNEIRDKSISRPNQSLRTAYALDNVGRVYGRYATSMKNESLDGSDTNLKHSLTGTSAVTPDDVGASGKVNHVHIPNH